MVQIGEDVEFNRPKKFKFLERIGSGACGETALLFDTDLGIKIVSKKFRPFLEKDSNVDLFEDLMNRFKREAQILFSINHPNIVRVYSYFSYPARDTAYIHMEHVCGGSILEYCNGYPTLLEVIFEQLIEGFFHLESVGILHRDIRPQNILVTEQSIVKILDFGFGKNVEHDSSSQEKSISLNWWCEPPDDFISGKYDQSTEVYFVGRLFEECLLKSGRTDFHYVSTVKKMCCKDRSLRFASFAEVRNSLTRASVQSLKFSDLDVTVYRSFADGLRSAFSSIGHMAVIVSDYEAIFPRLKELVQDVMLEENIPNIVNLARIFVTGEFRYFKRHAFTTETLLNFIELLERLDHQRQVVVLRNLRGKLDSVERKNYADDEIPF